MQSKPTDAEQTNKKPEFEASEFRLFLAVGRVSDPE
jgi:hypothetical protein